MVIESAQHAAPNWVPVRDKPVFSHDRKLKVICVGAGFAGLLITHKWKYEGMHEFFDLDIFEKYPDVGGTWFENRYPGAGCDVPAHLYCFLFEPNPDWSRFYAKGPEIQDYIKRTTKKYGLDERVQFNSKVLSATWNEVTAKWQVKVDQGGKLFDAEADILINGSGGMNKWRMPEIDGLHSFKGKLLHTARWDESLDWKGKKVAIIGNGSSAIQVLPSMQAEARQIVNYMRSPTWITPNFGAHLLPEGRDFEYPEEVKKKFRENPEELLQYRKKAEHEMNKAFYSHMANSPEQAALISASRKKMEAAFKDHPEILAKMLPKFAVGCRRVSPGDLYLEALVKPNVRVEFDPITRITEKGIVTKGQEPKTEEFDIIVCATGFYVDFIPMYDVVGKNGTRLADLWRDRSAAYFGVCSPAFPNYFIINGPNSPVAHGSLLSVMDFTVDWINRWLKKMVEEDIRSVTVKQERFEDYNAYCEEIYKRTVWVDNCNSWFKAKNNPKGGVSIMYAGNVLHYKEIMESFRTEDFDITYNSRNLYSFMGNGFTKRDEKREDLAFYLKK